MSFKKKYDLEIKAGTYEVLASGVINTTENEISFTLDGMCIRYKFVTKLDEKSKYESEIINNKEMIISLVNFSNKFGEGVKKPIEIGTIGENEENKLFVTFNVKSYKIDDEIVNREFIYSFLAMANEPC